MLELFGSVARVLNDLQRRGRLDKFPLEPLDISASIQAVCPYVDNVQISEVDNGRFRSKQAVVLGYIKFVRDVSAPYRSGEGQLNALIYVRRGLSSQVKRTVICKELCHILLHKDPSCHADTELKLIELAGALTAGAETKKLIVDDKKYKNERMAEIAAAEILCPRSFRPSPEAISSGSVTVDVIAERFGVMPNFARLIADQFYTSITSPMWEALLQEQAAKPVQRLRRASK